MKCITCNEKMKEFEDFYELDNCGERDFVYTLFWCKKCGTMHKHHECEIDSTWHVPGITKEE